MNSEKIRAIYDGYLQYLMEGGKRIRVPQTEPVHYDGYVHASNLMDCPLKAKKERNKEPAVFSHLLKENAPTVLHRMMHGERIAEIFQEAFLWERDNDFELSVQPEYSLVSHNLKLQGRADIITEQGIYNTPDYKRSVIEIKHRLPTWKDKFPQPRMGDVFQDLAYKYMAGADEVNLIIVNTPSYADFYDPTKGYTIWTLYQDDENRDGFVLQDENLDAWQHNFNHGAYINRDTLELEVSRQLAYLGGLTVPPIDLGTEGDWQCRKTIRYPKDNSPGTLIPMCSWWCHTDNPQPEMDYVIDEDGSWIIL